MFTPQDSSGMVELTCVVLRGELEMSVKVYLTPKSLFIFTSSCVQHVRIPLAKSLKILMVSMLKLLFYLWKRFSENLVIFLTQLLVAENQVWSRKMIAVWMYHV